MEDKIQIAINHLKVGNLHQPHIDMAIEALEKQIPKEPIIESWMPTLCPNCKCSLSKSLGDGFYEDIKKLVCDCGQKLKWD